MAETPSTTRTGTQTIESDLAVATIVALIPNPIHIPEWAPTFADSVSSDIGGLATGQGGDPTCDRADMPSPVPSLRAPGLEAHPHRPRRGPRTGPLLHLPSPGRQATLDGGSSRSGSRMHH